MAKILCIDDEPSVGVVLEGTLRDFGHRPHLVATVAEGLKSLTREPFDLVISDCEMPESSGIDLIELMRDQGVDVPVIITTGYASVEDAVQAMRRGAADYLTKPLRNESLRLAVHNAIELHRLRRQNEAVTRELRLLRGSRPIVGDSPAIRHVLEMIHAVAPTGATLLLEGESGTGKELIARAVHEQSPRAEGPFVCVNCAALPEGLVESTLFGHERGAFTGATMRAIGAFERAHGGTLLLDEVSEMRLDLQAKLLRAIQEQEFERVGGHQPIKVDVRIVATTNRDLAGEVEAGRFRRDLFYRLHVVPIHLPPLRDRPEDVPLLVAHFVQDVAGRFGSKPPVVQAAAIEYLQRQPWPGNVRELANAIERAMIFHRGGELGVESFAGTGGGPRAARERCGPEPDPAEAILNLKVLERLTIERALRATGGHRIKTAELLGISERTLRNKLNSPQH